MTIDIDSLLFRVRPWAPGVPDQVAVRGLRDAAIEFCERTKLWKWESTTAVLAVDPATFSVTVPTDAALHELDHSQFAGAPLEPKSTADLDCELTGWSNGVISAGQPRFITQIEQDTFTLVPSPSADGSLYIRARLKPSQDALTLPDFLGKYSEALGWGALSRILMVPGQSYTAPDVAGAYVARWNLKIDTLTGKHVKGQQRARVQTRLVLF